jgi:hypothetical protein
VPIGNCLAQNQKGGDLATVGMAMVEAATSLNAAGRSDPGGRAPLRLGYLVGAAQHGAEATSGIHADLLRRLRAAALYSPGGRPLPEAFRRGYEQGLAAGNRHG